jgi:hypothetical protein
MLGQVIEALTGAKYRQVVSERILTPIGMTHTDWEPASPAAQGYFIHPYEDVPIAEPAVDLESLSSFGQLWSTTDDMIRWADALSGGRQDVVANDVIEAMHDVHVVTDHNSWNNGWGLGLSFRRREGKILGGHDGIMPGFVTGLAFHKESKVSAVVLSNVTTGIDCLSMADDLVLAALELPDQDASFWRPAEPVPRDLDGLLGPWWSEGREAVFSWRDNQLRATFKSGPEEGLESSFEETRTDVFRVIDGPELGETLTIARDHDGHIVKLWWACYPWLRIPYQLGH